MNEPKQSIFRKSALDQMRSPENLNEYIRVTTPTAWLLVISVAAVLVGFVLWGVFGSVEVVGANGATEHIRPIEF